MKCDQRNCPALVADPDGRDGRRKHRNSQGGANGFVKKRLAYRIPPSLVRYVSGLGDAPEPRCKPLGKNQTYAVQSKKVAQICENLCVAPTVDAFSEAGSARFSRWWGPESPEAANAFDQPWGGEVVQLPPSRPLPSRFASRIPRAGPGVL